MYIYTDTPIYCSAESHWETGQKATGSLLENTRRPLRGVDVMDDFFRSTKEAGNTTVSHNKIQFHFFFFFFFWTEMPVKAVPRRTQTFTATTVWSGLRKITDIRCLKKKKKNCQKSLSTWKPQASHSLAEHTHKKNTDSCRRISAATTDRFFFFLKVWRLNH